MVSTIDQDLNPFGRPPAGNRFTALSRKLSVGNATQTIDNACQHSTSIAAFSMLSRRRRNQRTLDGIDDPVMKTHATLARIERDITDNVQCAHRAG